MTVRLPKRAAASIIGMVFGSITLAAQVFPLGQLQKPSPAVPLPATPITAPAASTPAITGVSAQKPVHRAEVTFAKGQLAIKADNSSLNLILREVGRQTGIRITGGVTEERVFGNYGPAPAGEVLNKLLDGTGSNVMLIAGDGTSSGELILTPRLGGATPPNPNARSLDEDSDEDADAPRRPQPRGVTLFGDAGGVDAPPQVPPPANNPPATPTASDPAAAASPVNQQSPNGVKTPQEIYQQLQQLRQQQQQQAVPPQ